MGAEPLWADLPYEIILRIIEITTDKCSLSAWTRVNKKCKNIAHPRLWRDLLIDLNNPNLYGRDREEGWFHCTMGPWDKENRPLIKSLQIGYSTSNLDNILFNESLMPGTMENLAHVAMSGPLRNRNFDFLRDPKSSLESIEIRSPQYHPCLLHRSWEPSTIIPLPLKQHTSLRVLKVSELFYGEVVLLAGAIRELSLEVLEIRCAHYPKVVYDTFSMHNSSLLPLQLFFRALHSTNPVFPRRQGFPPALKVLLLEDGVPRTPLQNSIYGVRWCSAIKPCAHIQTLQIHIPDTPSRMLETLSELPTLTDLTLHASILRFPSIKLLYRFLKHPSTNLEHFSLFGIRDLEPSTDSIIPTLFTEPFWCARSLFLDRILDAIPNSPPMPNAHILEPPSSQDSRSTPNVCLADPPFSRNSPHPPKPHRHSSLSTHIFGSPIRAHRYGSQMRRLMLRVNFPAPLTLDNISSLRALRVLVILPEHTDRETDPCFAEFAAGEIARQHMAHLRIIYIGQHEFWIQREGGIVRLWRLGDAVRKPAAAGFGMEAVGRGDWAFLGRCRGVGVGVGGLGASGWGAVMGLFFRGVGRMIDK